MMQKPTAATVAAFESAFPDDPRAVRKTMFGMAAGVVNGNLFAGVFEQGITLRVGRARAEELADSYEGVGPFAPGGRTWPEYALAVAERWAGTDELKAWVREALEHTAALPVKESKPKAKPKAPKGRR
jgi:TfoX/Sxy family transcriptional regulator of competence genes